MGSESNITWCTPLPQLNCHGDEKCTFIVESLEPYLGRTDCAPVGPVQDEGPCAIDETTGHDDCAAGLFCVEGYCTEICDVVSNDQCDPEESCVLERGTFSGWDNVGVCRQACDPVAPGGTACAADEGCYLNLRSGRFACMPPDVTDPVAVEPEPWCATMPATQGCSCEWLSGCAAGYSCVLLDDRVAPTGSLCGFLCDASASGGPTCEDGPGATFECRRINELYSDELFPDVAALDDAMGVCVD